MNHLSSMVSGTTPRRIRSMSSCENTRSSVTDALRPGRAQVFHVLGTAVRSCGLISCLSLPRRPCSIRRRAEPRRCHRRLAGAVRHTGRTRGCTTSAVATSPADPEPRRPGSIRTCPPSTPALRARSASSFFGGEPSPGRPTNIVNTRLRCPGGVRRDAPGRWCADAGRPPRFKPSSPSPTDAVRDGSAKLGHPVQNVTREHGLTPLPR